jgi:hypothetical protein
MPGGREHYKTFTDISNIDVSLQIINPTLLIITPNSFEISCAGEQLWITGLFGRNKMKAAAILIAGVSLIAAGTAAASPRMSDLDYLRASRCKGIAEAAGVDTAGVDALLKGAKMSRQPVINERAAAEMARAKRDLRGAQKDKVSAELSGGCAPYMGGPEDFAAAKAPSKAQ